MPATRDSSGALAMGGVPLAALARDSTIGTPTYVYDLDAIAEEARALRGAFEGVAHLVAYAVKANTAGPIVRTLVAEGCGADVVSGAELLVALGCGVAPERIVYSGVAKTDDELARAISCGERGICAIQLESVEEIVRVASRARALGRRARVSVRINPSVDVGALDTHAHIATGHDEAKFGVPLEDVSLAIDAVLGAKELELTGLTAHGGSQFTSTQAYVGSARALFAVARQVRARPGVALAYIDTGGGFGIDYGSGCSVRPADFVREVRAEQHAAGLDDLALYVEPGRSLVAAHGVLLAGVIQAKVTRLRRWLMVDAGMNDLIRPALYQALHRVVPLEGGAGPVEKWTVVGPVCESADDFGAHALPATPPRAIALLDAGAYGYTMASRYNGRQLPAEVFLRGGAVVARTERLPPEEWARNRTSM